MHARDSAPLPDPVRRYLERALPSDSGAAAPRVVTVTQEGEFRLKDAPDGWRPFTATETFELDPPAFAWEARIRAAPLVSVRVSDGYRAGEGRMRARVWGVIPVMNEKGPGDLAAGALSRYLAEAAWFPWRLRPGAGLSWRPDDDSHAFATLRDAGVEVEIRFGFDDAGELVEASALRARKSGDGYVDTPWIGRFAEHARLGGVRIPRWGEVAWIVEGEERPYWRGRITALATSSQDT